MYPLRVKSLELLFGLPVKDLDQVTAVVHVQSLAWELLHAVGMAKGMCEVSVFPNQVELLLFRLTGLHCQRFWHLLFPVLDPPH